MARPRLYIFAGYPGAGKTTVATLLAAATGAEHIWADKLRKEIFGNPNHSRAESLKLYNRLNKVTDELLASGKSVIFDTNFNFRKDRDHLRAIAAAHGASTTVVWITTPRALAKDRAVHARQLRNGYEYVLPQDAFERMANHLQPPGDDENVIKIDGTNIDEQAVLELLTKHA